jgi:hypothetical protein
MPKATPIVPITFAVLRGDKSANVTLSFADNADVISTTRWRVPSELDDNALMQSRAADAREFARLAAKRWRHYRDTETAARSLTELQRMIAADPQGEYCFHVKVSADWFPASLGGAMVRRTWCHHLMIDFLFVHPKICGKVTPVKGVGIEILRAICLIARVLKCKRVWGEATLDSAPFYKRQLHQIVEDHFHIERPQIADMADHLESERLTS